MSYQNIETLDGKISSIVKGLNNENSLEILKEAPTINKSYKTLESLVKNNMPSSPINHFLKNSLKTILYQIYAHPIMLSTILSQCRVGEYPKMGLLESLKQIKSEKGIRGLYTGVFPSILSMLATHASETAITYSLLKIFDSSLNVIKSSFSDYAENQMNPMNGGDQNNNNNLTKLNLQKESIEKIRKLFRWILLLIVTPLIRVLVKQPLDVITANTIKESFQGANKNENMLFLYQMYRTIRNIFKEKGIRGFYAGTFSSTWSSFFTSIFMIVPLPYFGVSSNSKSILNLIFGQFLEYSFFTTKLRMATQPSPTSESSNLLPSGALSSFSHIVSREGWSSLLSGVSKYVFLSPIVALQYYFNSKEKTNTQTPNLFDLFAPNNLDQLPQDN